MALWWTIVRWFSHEPVEIEIEEEDADFDPELYQQYRAALSEIEYGRYRF